MKTSLFIVYNKVMFVIYYGDDFIHFTDSLHRLDSFYARVSPEFKFKDLGRQVNSWSLNQIGHLLNFYK